MAELFRAWCFDCSNQAAAVVVDGDGICDRCAKRREAGLPSKAEEQRQAAQAASASRYTWIRGAYDDPGVRR